MKKSKKFVLAGLVLLAITGLLALAGCKNDTVPPEVEKQEQGDGGGSETDKNNTAAKLVSISVTTLPAQTVYSERQSFDPTGMVVTATYDDKSQREVTGWETDFNTVAGEKGLNKPVTVSYTEGETTKTNTFSVTVFPAEVEVLTGYTSPNNTDGSWIYVEFGEWPQTEAVNFKPTTASQSHGIFDGNYYVEGNDKYVEKDGKYYKVEPIVWRVLTTSYEAPEGGTVGEILLLAEKILTGGIPYYDVWDTNRTVGEATIHPNNYEHSQIRAWLNGLSYQSKESEGATQSPKDEYKNAGFLQTAFTESAQKLIADTTVDNSVTSTFGTGESTWDNPYACDKTKDKIFLLSEQEATESEYGFGAYSESGKGNTRIRVTTDYAEATGVYQGNPSEGYGGWWWLRSPYFDSDCYARDIYINGYAYSTDSYVDLTDVGVVPALSISLQ